MSKYFSYGAILGGIDLPVRQPSVEQDGADAVAEFKYMVQPPVNEDGESCSVLLYGMETRDSYVNHQFIGYLMEGKFYCDGGYSPHQCYHVTHWQTLPPPPTE